MIGALQHGATALALAPSPRPRSEAADAPQDRAPEGLVGPLTRTDDVARLYRSHGHLVLRRARALLGNEADAQEALQEVFAALLRSHDAPGTIRSVVGWLYAATTHHCLNLLRDRRTGAQLLEREVLPAMPEGDQARADALALARDLIARLPDEIGAALVYHYVDGMTYEEVAEQMGCSRRKVGYLLASALEVAARELAEPAELA